MQTLVERGCGLDVHQATVVACLLIVLKSGKVQKQVRTFGTTTRELLSLREWLLAEGCTHVAMESTGVYWKPVYAILEGALEIVVANAQHVKKVPGRKTDVKDAEWIADLLCHGLLRASFVPPKLIRELRDLTRYRRKLVESQAAERNRLLKLLETANIKPDFAVDRLRASGRHASHLISYISASESNRFSKSTRLRGTRWCVRRFSSLAATASPRPRDAHRHQEDKNRGPGKQVHPEANGDAAPRGRQAISEGEEGACDVVSCFCSLFRSQGRRRRRKANCMRTSR